jgi:calcineurin-like phosphoesterase family protein
MPKSRKPQTPKPHLGRPPSGGAGAPTGPGISPSPGIGPGPAERQFAEPHPSPDEVNFVTTVDDKKYYSFLVKAAQPIPPPSRTPIMQLAEVIGQDQVNAITQAGHIVFHSVGDTGPVRGPGTEASVADRMVEDFSEPNPADRPAFFFHLGDVVYNFGENQYYYDQFYEPYRNYPAPIFAIPGNHDGMVYTADQAQSLEAFLQQFCTAQPVHPPQAGGLIRTTMTQPGVYFTLEAPFVTIIGLYSNALEMFGKISSEGGAYPQIGDDQLNFLTSELKRIAAQRASGNRTALILATHHPPYSADSKHGGSPRMLQDIDTAVQASGCVPDAYLCGHAHLYQRFTRTYQGRQIPFITAGSGGHNVTPLQGKGQIRTPLAGKGPSSGVILEKSFAAYGYLRIIADPASLTLEFYETAGGSTQSKSPSDSCRVDLATHKLQATIA